MIVRLKDPRRAGGGWGKILFQFYDSPIKSCAHQSTHAGPVVAFQFYDSPIKSVFGFGGGCTQIINFNSMIVRLKEFIPEVLAWNYHDISIL